MRYEAVRFQTEKDLAKAVQALDELEHEPIEYDILIGSAILVVPARLSTTLWNLINDQGLEATSVPTKAMRDLDPKEQLLLRKGQIGSRKSA